MMMAITYGEAGGPVPSPMTLSRWDNVGVSASNANLFAFGQTSGAYVNAFFSPGIGMWQFDSAGAWPFSAAGAIDSVTSANQAATTISYRWCNAPSSQQTTEAARRKYAWGPWFGCSSGTPSPCEAVYASLASGDKLNTAFDAVGHPLRRHAAAHLQRRTAWVTASPAGTSTRRSPRDPRAGPAGTYNGTSSGVTPLPKPFYVVEANGREYRIWLPADTGYDIGITASKPITANARTSLTWSSSAALCDVTAARGLCQGRIAVTPSGPKVADPFGSLDGATAAADRTVTRPRVGHRPRHQRPDRRPRLPRRQLRRGRDARTRPAPTWPLPCPATATCHGYRSVLSGVTPGAHQVCSYAINVGPYGTTNPQLGCVPVTVTGNPFGNLESASRGAGGPGHRMGHRPRHLRPARRARLRRRHLWPAPSPPPPAGRHRGACTRGPEPPTATTPSCPSAGGSHQVCAYGINVGPTGTQNVKLGCATVVVNGSPLGSLDAVGGDRRGVSVSGWAFDPDTSAATVQVRIDGGAPVAVPTDRRPRRRRRSVPRTG